MIQRQMFASMFESMMLPNEMLKKGVGKHSVLLVLLAILPGLPVKAVVSFEKVPGITCGVLGREAHLVWKYNDDTDNVIIIRWYEGTGTGTGMGTYVTASETFTAFPDYKEKINFTAPSNVDGLKGAGLTFYGLEATDAGIYTTVFQATSSTPNDIATLEVVEAADLGTWEICDDDDTCNAISDPLTLRASGNVTVRFTKGGTLTCDMDIDIDVTPSVGPSCRQEVNLTAECDLGDAASLVRAGTLSITAKFGKNGEVFYTHIIAVSVISDATESTTAATTTNTNTTSTSPDTPGSPNTWNDLYVIPIVLGVCIIVIIIVVVVVVRRRKKMETGRPHPQDRSSGVSVGASAAGMPPGGQPRHKAQPNPQSGAPSGDMAYKVGYVDPDAPALFHDDRYDSGFGNTGYAH